MSVEGIRSLAALATALLAMALPVQAWSSYHDFNDSTDLNFEVVKDLVQRENLATIEETLEKLKSSYPAYFETYMLMYRSRSLQESSFENPRAILFDRSAQFVFSFNGDPDHRGYDKLEIMQFRPGEDRFEFREVVFEPGKSPEFSEPNPKKCMVCHQSATRRTIDPRPNWEPYNIWPGAFGSLSGDVETSAHRRSQISDRGGDEILVKDAEREEAGLKDFFEKYQPDHPRYKFLDAEQFDAHFTVQFTQFMANLNFRRIVRMVYEEWGRYSFYFAPAFETIVRCGSVPLGSRNYQWAIENLPEQYSSIATNIKKKNQILSRTGLKVRAKQAIRFQKKILSWEEEPWTEEELAEKIEELRQENEWQYYNNPSAKISDALTLLFEPFGIDTSDWSMDFRTEGSLAFSERFGTPSNTRNTLRNSFHHRMGRDHLKRFGKSCDDMAKVAAERMNEFRNSKGFVQLQKLKKRRNRVENYPLMNRCTKCHTDRDKDIPYIPFDQEDKLAKLLHQPTELRPELTLLEDLRERLSDSATADLRMPIGPVVRREQRHQLIEYFEGLAKTTH